VSGIVKNLNDAGVTGGNVSSNANFNIPKGQTPLVNVITSDITQDGGRGN